MSLTTSTATEAIAPKAAPEAIEAPKSAAPTSAAGKAINETKDGSTGTTTAAHDTKPGGGLKGLREGIKSHGGPTKSSENAGKKAASKSGGRHRAHK